MRLVGHVISTMLWIATAMAWHRMMMHGKLWRTPVRLLLLLHLRRHCWASAVARRGVVTWGTLVSTHLMRERRRLGCLPWVSGLTWDRTTCRVATSLIGVEGLRWWSTSLRGLMERDAAWGRITMVLWCWWSMICRVWIITVSSVCLFCRVVIIVWWYIEGLMQLKFLCLPTGYLSSSHTWWVRFLMFATRGPAYWATIVILLLRGRGWHHRMRLDWWWSLVDQGLR